MLRTFSTKCILYVILLYTFFCIIKDNLKNVVRLQIEKAKNILRFPGSLIFLIPSNFSIDTERLLKPSTLMEGVEVRGEKR